MSAKPMTNRELGEALQALMRRIGVEEGNPLDRAGNNYTISFTEQHGLILGLRVYQNGKQLIGYETAFPEAGSDA